MQAGVSLADGLTSRAALTRLCVQVDLPGGRTLYLGTQGVIPLGWLHDVIFFFLVR